MIGEPGWPPGFACDRDQLIRDHLHMVNFVADRMLTQVPGHLTRDDVVSAAMHGLVDAAGRFAAGE